MTYEKIFRTEKGSEYLRDSGTGLWIRSGKDIPPCFYIGSIYPKKNSAFEDDGRYYPTLLEQIYRSHDSGFSGKNVPGFVPRFVVGNSPLGVFCSLEQILEVKEGRIKIGIPVDIHAGHSIVEVHVQLLPFMEQNLAK